MPLQPVGTHGPSTDRASDSNQSANPSLGRGPCTSMGRRQPSEWNRCRPLKDRETNPETDVRYWHLAEIDFDRGHSALGGKRTSLIRPPMYAHDAKADILWLDAGRVL